MTHRTGRMRCGAGLVPLLITIFLGSCAPPSYEPTFHAEGLPQKLSDWNILRAQNGILSLNDRVTPYDLATPLFSDYALKLRTITLPEGASAVYDPENELALPVGTIITKTFYYPQDGARWSGAVIQEDERPLSGGALPLGGLRLIETRVLAHREDGWIALPYVWNADQTDADLKRTGAITPISLRRADGRVEEFPYIVPNTNQCAGCHATNNATRAIAPIGVKARHLDRASTFASGINQLDFWISSGLLERPHDQIAHARIVSWADETSTIDARARAYLDINCSHCHSDVGPADTSGLDLRPGVPTGPKLGICKSPIAAGSGTGGRLFDIVPGRPDESITVYRLETNAPGAMMPELGRAISHEEGAALIRAWIAEMSGGCG